MKPASPWTTARYHARALRDALLDIVRDSWDSFIKRNIVDNDPDEPILVPFDPRTRWMGMGATDAAIVTDFLEQIEPSLRPLTDGRRRTW